MLYWKHDYSFFLHHQYEWYFLKKKPAMFGGELINQYMYMEIILIHYASKNGQVHSRQIISSGFKYITEISNLTLTVDQNI